MPFALNPNGWVAGPGFPDGAGVADAAGDGGVAAGADAAGSSDGDEADEPEGAVGDRATDVPLLTAVTPREDEGSPLGLAAAPEPAGGLELPQAATASATTVARNALRVDLERRDRGLGGRPCTPEA